ncbi:piggyBac transposable element-derived protein 4 [Trichonephila clavipes]|nr:piggyBac transposable element-derived protein 4 [Trichonephila clavipes]
MRSCIILMKCKVSQCSNKGLSFRLVTHQKRKVHFSKCHQLEQEVNETCIFALYQLKPLKSVLYSRSDCNSGSTVRKFTCRNCGGGDRGRVAIYRPFGEVSLSLNRTVTCMVLKANDRRTSCPCHDEFRGPRSDYVRQIELDVSANLDEEADGLFAWKEVEGSEMINVLPFSSKVGLKVDAISFKTENDFFKLMLTDEILAVLVEETNRYAFDLLNLHGELSDKRKHASSWKPTDKNEILKFLGLILLMGHIEKDSLQDYWTTDTLIETPIFREVIPPRSFPNYFKILTLF